MRTPRDGRRGVVLLQVMILSIVLGLTAMMMIQWQYGRYVIAYKVENDERSRLILEAALNQAIAGWVNSYSAPPSTSVTVKVYDVIYGCCSVTISLSQAIDGARSLTYPDPENVSASFDPDSDCVSTDSSCS